MLWGEDVGGVVGMRVCTVYGGRASGGSLSRRVWREERCVVERERGGGGERWGGRGEGREGVREGGEGREREKREARGERIGKGGRGWFVYCLV